MNRLAFFNYSYILMERLNFKNNWWLITNLELLIYIMNLDIYTVFNLGYYIVGCESINKK